MASSTFADFFLSVDKVITGVFTAASAGMSAYILPVGWMMFGVSVLVWAFLVMNGKIDSPMTDWVMKGLTMLLVLTAAGSMYSSWISGPLFQLPTDLSQAIGTSGNPSQVLDSLDDKVESMLAGIASAVVDNFQNLNIGGGLILLVALGLVTIASVLLLTAAAFNILYAKIGLGIVLALGPFYVIWLMWKQTQQWFWSWLNTAMYFVFLSVCSALFIVLFVQIADGYMLKLADAVTALAPAPPGASMADKIAGFIKQSFQVVPDQAQMVASLSVLRIVFQLVFICIPLFFIEIQLPTLVASMTGGSGGSSQSGAYNAMRTIQMAAKAAKAGKGKGK